MGILNDPVVSTSLVIVAWAVFWHHWHGLGITLGYHRLLTHKSLVVPKWLEYLIVSNGYFALMGSPIVWVGVHRQHHQRSDQPGDPHSPRDGFWHALYKWMYYAGDLQSDAEVQKQAHDLMNDPVYSRLGIEHGAYHAKLNVALSVVFRLFLLALFGWPCVVGNLIGTFTIFWSTQFVNTFCHLPAVGYRTYKTTEDSRNVWWVGLLALGEGWHNNHHAVPKSARHGLQWWEFDFTWAMIVVLERLGLVKRVVRPSQVLLDKKRESIVDKAHQTVSAAVRDASLAAKEAVESARRNAEMAAIAAIEAAENAGKSARDAAESASHAAREAAESAGKAAREAALAAGKSAGEAAEAASLVAREALEAAEAVIVPHSESVPG